MSTRHVVLALLDIQPMTGYDIRAHFPVSLGSLWSASYGQIYPTLHKLHEDGLVTRTDKQSGQRKRFEYAITEAGKAELLSWLHEPVEYPPARDPFLFWASNMNVLPHDVVRAGITRHIELHADRKQFLDDIIASILDGTHPLIESRAATLTPAELQRLQRTRAFVFEELAQRAQEEIDRANRLRVYYETSLAESEASEKSLQ